MMRCVCASSPEPQRTLNTMNMDRINGGCLFFSQMAKKEKTWSLHAEDEELVQDLVDWITDQWETMFGVKLATIKQ